MGEIADYYIERMLEDHFSHSDDEDYEVACNRCGVPGLTWGTDGRKWFLIDSDGDRHVCRASDDDFEDMP